MLKISDQELKDRVVYIIDGGECQIGVESTVVRVIDGIPHILDPEKITAEEIKEVAGSVIIDKHILSKLDANEKVMSPGMKYKHYAPNTKCVLVYNDDKEILRANICKTVGDCYTSNKVPLVMCLDENAEFLKNMYQNYKYLISALRLMKCLKTYSPICEKPIEPMQI